MQSFGKFKQRASQMLGGVAAGLLLTGVACGAAATATPAPPAGKAPAVAPTPTKASVAAAPKPTPAPTAIPKVVKPTGTLNAGQKELSSYMGHPRLMGNPQLFLNTGPAGIQEGLVTHTNKARELVPMLAEAWSISPDFKVWTFNIRKGVKFHKGYGEMTAEDVAWSAKEFTESKKHPSAGEIKAQWANPKGSVTTPDPYTVVLDLGVPRAVDTVFQQTRNPTAGAIRITSKKQSDQLGAEKTNSETAATGPWEIVEFKTGEFWRLKAVEDHWRKTPFFAELVLWEIPEESSRVAGFQTGQLDTIIMALDSIPLAEKVKGARLMRVPDAGESNLNIYGNSYVGIGTPDQLPNFDPTLPWVSPTADVNSREWDRARKVRLALAIAIDRQTIVDTVLRGYGRPLVMGTWTGHEDRLPLDMKWEFNLKRAKELLAEAGYPKGFSLTLTPSIRGAPAETEACELVGTMWRDIGIDVKFQKVPYETLRAQLVGRTYKGFTCHASAPTLVPATGWASWLSKKGKGSVYYRGAEHEWQDEWVTKTFQAVDPKEREELELKVTRFMYDNVMTSVGLYVFDNVYPVGARVEEWTQHIRMGDTRNINGMEWAQHRKQ